MGGSATLGTNLVDSLVEDVVDALRDELHPDFGVRQYRVYTVLRTWDTAVGEGEYTDVETQIEPQPLVTHLDSELKLAQCGLDEVSNIKLTEVSLTYTEAELTGLWGQGAPGLDKTTEEFLYKLEDAHGQGIQDSYWILQRRPYTDRIQDIGWVVYLKRASDSA